MTITQTSELPTRVPLRLWPGVVAVALQWLGWVIIPVFFPEAAIYGMIGGIFGGGLAVLLWWLFFSRLPWSERVGVLLLMPIMVFATSRLVHASIANGMNGMMLPIISIPVLCLALVVAAAAGRRLATGSRRAILVAAILLACGALNLVRTGGLTGEGDSDFRWRWTPTPEERLLAEARNEPPAAPAAAAVDAADTRTKSDWPGFRGPDRDSVVRGVRIETDWAQSPPVELWRRKIGPGWSSFSVHDDVFYTQEQRGDQEDVSCYKLTTGEPVWRHHDAARFWESNGGAGPRGTPTLNNGRVYTLGATGIVNALDAGNGAAVWSRNAMSDTGAPMPGWGFAASPVVVNDVVIVAASGRLAGYDIATGNPRWFYKTGGGGYSSPHLATIAGVPQVLLLSGVGAASVAPSDGALLWKHSWESGVAIVQPALTADGDVLITVGDAMGAAGIRRIAVAHGSGGWTTEVRWTSTGLKPYFNDFVVHRGHAFGFDGSIMACIDLQDGKRKWKGGRYGYGQLVLLPDQDLLLVLSEEGELALVRAMPDQFTEVARFKALEGKTWNHPVLVGDTLLARNGEEMAAFRLSLASAPHAAETKR